MGKRVQIKMGAPRRATLDTLRKRVTDAEEELALAEEAEVNNEGDDGDGGATHIHIHTGNNPNSDVTDDDGEVDPAAAQGNENPMDARIAAIEASIEKLTASVAALASGGAPKTEDADEADPEDDEDGSSNVDPESAATGDDGEMDEEDEASGKTMDSAALETGYTALLAKAEVLVPGFRVPTFDAKAKRKKTVDAMCGLRRKVVDAAYMTKDGQALINGITGKTTLTLDKMGCKDVAVLFNAAAGAKALMNNQQATRDSASKEPEAKRPLTIADINKANAEYWAKHGPAR